MTASDHDRDLDRRLRERWSTALMNDTKWREVWLVIVELGVRLYFSYADSDDWNAANASRLFGPFRVEHVWERGIRDPGIGGPFLFKQILEIRVPRHSPPRPGVGPIVMNDLDVLVHRLRELGEIPVSTNDEVVVIRGYASSTR